MQKDIMTNINKYFVQMANILPYMKKYFEKTKKLLNAVELEIEIKSIIPVIPKWSLGIDTMMYVICQMIGLSDYEIRINPGLMSNGKFNGKCKKSSLPYFIIDLKEHPKQQKHFLTNPELLAYGTMPPFLLEKKGIVANNKLILNRIPTHASYLPRIIPSYSYRLYIYEDGTHQLL